LVVRIQNVLKRFHERPAVDGVSLDVNEGDLVALIGPSGCGKSTLLRCINGLEAVDEGRIDVLGTTLCSPREIGAREFQRRALRVRRDVGMVFQSFNLFPHLTIFENVMKAPRVVRGLGMNAAMEAAHALLVKVGLGDKAERYPEQLSGGQQQRAAIARALAMAPKILLYDEPTSALDPTLVQEVLRVMKQLDQDGMTQIVVTHEMRFARDVADRIAFVENGRIVEIGVPEQIFGGGAVDERTRDFLRHFQ
jgi:polar amino acid transport system ATP-binding protein